VIHVKLVDQFSPGSPWPNEFLQRNSIIKGLVKCQPEDVILMGDVDEIPDPDKFSEMVSLAKSGRVVTFKQKMYRYFLNIRCTHELWSGTRAISMQNLWDKFAGSLERLRHHDEIFIEGGHHFTGVQGLEAFMKKMESFSHNDICDVPKYRDPENMKKLFENNVVNKGLDVHHFNRSTYFIESPDSDFLPKGIDKSKYEKMIYKGGEWR
jgi:beta-1,4-mannosyl-glycoprotein beta-1,4-N-acetylglucosaminyltransferase